MLSNPGEARDTCPTGRTVNTASSWIKRETSGSAEPSCRPRAALEAQQEERGAQGLEEQEREELRAVQEAQADQEEMLRHRNH